MWLPADEPVLPAVKGFLARREWACCALSCRVLASGEPRYPAPEGGRLFAWVEGSRGSAIAPPAAGLFLAAASGSLYPALADSPPDRDGELLALADVKRRGTSACIGLARDVARVESALGLASADGNDYFLMVLDSGRIACGLDSPVEGLTAFVPRKSDLGGIFPLQAAYEKEEVLVSIHRHDPKATRAALASALDAQEMLCASLDGRIVAKAQTNARGIAYDQLGGIYVEPGLRGRGVGTWLVASLCQRLIGQGRCLTLFVKKKNAAAIGSYRRIGFSFRDSYRISYYS